MVVLKCKMCGGDLPSSERASTLTCEYCGITQTIPKVDDEKKLIQFERAERLRRQCEFDKAAGIYESIVADFRQEAEAYWGLVLCKYGIEYVDDPATGKKIPTCHRSSFDSIMEDEDFEQALENADSVARKVYREEAKTIEEIRKGIVAVSANEQPYDIFICYKETAEDGDRTLDSVLAQDIYDALTDKGYRVFFSRITLEDKLGLEYEPYIFAALNSAKIMLAVGTDYEYYNAVWVKNEWSRFLKLMAQDKEKHLIPCYKNIDAYDMPKEFAKLQAQDLGKVGALQDLLRGIEKLLPKQAVPVVTAAPTANVNAMVMRGQFALDDGDFVKADEYFDRALDQNPQEGLAYLGKVLAALHMSQPEEINSRVVNLDTFKDFGRAIKFADPITAAKLTSIQEQNNRKFEAVRLISALNKVQKQKKQIEERLKQERQLVASRERVSSVQGIFSYNTAVLLDGTVKLAEPLPDNCKEVQNWRNIIAVCCCYKYEYTRFVGLKSDGTVVATGENNCRQCRVKDWTDIVSIAVGYEHTVGLKSDGTVVATGNNEKGQCDVQEWRDVVYIHAKHNLTIGVKSDGTLALAGDFGESKKVLESWRDIVSVSIAEYYSPGGSVQILGVKENGTVVSSFNSDFVNENEWKNIIAVSTNFRTSVGLRSDGTVVSTYGGWSAGCVDDWENVVAIKTYGFQDKAFTVGVQADGNVLVAGSEKASGNIQKWKLFNNLDTLNEDRIAARNEKKQKDEELRKKIAEASEKARREREEQARIAQEKKRMMAQRREDGFCQHCGGKFKGLFSKTCSVCGKPKDY